MSQVLEIPESIAIRLRFGGALSRLRAVVLLGGSVRPKLLARSIGRPVFALPLEDGLTILDAWRREIAALGRQIGRPDLPVRILLDRSAPEPGVPSLAPMKETATDSTAPAGEHLDFAPSHLAPLQLERDRFDFRGTGGVLRDLTTDYEPDDLLLTANAAQVLACPLADVAAALARTGGDVAIAANADGTPSGMMLVQTRALKSIPEEGFVDMKEQALPAIAANHRVTVATFDTPTGLPIRSLAEYVAALRQYHLARAGLAVDHDPFAENLESAFSIIEPGATVDPSARLHDSVVLAGGFVEAKATLVQSIICPGGRLRRGALAVDELVTSANGGGKGRD